MKIPKIIHFIWAGGEILMPNDNIVSLIAWHSANPAFEIWFWIDKKTFHKDLVKIYQDKISSTATFLKKTINISAIHFKDIEEEGMSDEYIRYEVDRLRPNYGASSDLLRYKILFTFGGAYFDTDIDPGKISLQESHIFDIELEHHRFYVDPDSQHSGQVGNDALICTPKNPYMQRILEIARRNYSEKKTYIITDEKTKHKFKINFSEWNPALLQCYRYDDASEKGYIADITPKKTGPGCVRVISDELCSSVKKKDVMNSPIFMMENLTLPKESNDLKWVGKRIVNCSVDEAIEKVLMTITFEIKYLKIIRLDDHISNIIESTSCIKNMVVKKLFDMLNTKKVNFDKIEYAQLTFCYKEVEEFYSTHHLMNKTYILPPIKAEDIYHDDVTIMIDVIMNPCYLDIMDTLSEKDKLVLSDQELIENALEHGLRFAEHIVSYIEIEKLINISKFSELNRYLTKVFDNLKRYQDIIEKQTVFKRFNDRVILLSEKIDQRLKMLEDAIGVKNKPSMEFK